MKDYINAVFQITSFIRSTKVNIITFIFVVVMLQTICQSCFFNIIYIRALREDGG